jgi:hypothetical protein
LLEPKRSASNGAEGRDRPWAIEINRSLTPKLEKGFTLLARILTPQEAFSSIQEQKLPF